MSCEVIAIPYAIAWVIGTVATTAANAIIDSLESVESNNTNCEKTKTITAEHFMEKDFETPFVDKNILLKTLEEHGATSINDDNLGISCNIDRYTLVFSRENTDQPYKLRMKYSNENSATEKLDDISSEYTLNVQEDTYMNIIEKIKDNNMEIENEEVMDDNTIVLTINVD